MLISTIKGKRILVAGGAGFIGSHFIDRILDEGAFVVCVDNLSSGRIGNLKDHKRLKYEDFDITDEFELKGPFFSVVNFASPASPPDYYKDPVGTLKAGSLGVLNLLKIARTNQCRFLQASTSEVYGDPLEHPQKETYFGNVNPVGERSCYDESKRFAEALIMAYRRSYQLDTKIARIFNTYGPRMRASDGRVIPNFVSQALLGKPLMINGDGRQTRSFCYVDDLVKGLLKLLLSDQSGPINLGNPQEITVEQCAREVIGLTRSKSHLAFCPAINDDPKVRRPDIALAKKYLDWEPTVSLKEGLNKTIIYFKNRC